jgi:hypothetical protein
LIYLSIHPLGISIDWLRSKATLSPLAMPSYFEKAGLRGIYLIKSPLRNVHEITSASCSLSLWERAGVREYKWSSYFMRVPYPLMPHF